MIQQIEREDYPRGKPERKKEVENRKEETMKENEK